MNGLKDIFGKKTESCNILNSKDAGLQPNNCKGRSCC